MAFASALSSSLVNFKPLSSSRANCNSNQQRISAKNSKTQKLKSRNCPPLPRLLSSTVDGGDATTFTRLPPKDDPSFGDLTSQPLTELIKLSESKPAANIKKKFDQKLGEKYGFDSENDINKANDEFDGRNDVKMGFNHGKFELYVLGSDDEDDFNDEEEEGSMVLNSEGVDEEEEIKESERGLPAVMRCFDRAKIFVKSGDGGNGVVAFRRESFVPFGGPSGGDGGRGGNVFVEVDGALNSLLPFRKRVHFRGGRGSHGQGQQKNGAKGEDVVVKVPPGTVVRKTGGDVLFELLSEGQRALLLPGGRGGRGNASFKTGMNTVPKIAENGEEGPEMWLELELKLIADVGIVGAPNAGKSTFLSVISAAQPAIANYPFTTLLPNLGILQFF